MIDLELKEENKGELYSCRDAFKIPTFIQMYVLQEFGERHLEGLSKNMRSILDGSFSWADTAQGGDFWINLLGSRAGGDCIIYRVDKHFNIPQFKKTNCLIHKLYWLILSSRNSTIVNRFKSIMSKKLSGYQGYELDRMCLYKYGKRMFECPCCGKLI